MKTYRYTVVVRGGLFWVRDTKLNEDVAFFRNWEDANKYCDARN